MRKAISLLLLLWSAGFLNAATVDTVSIYSKAMKRSSNCVVILPQYYQEGKHFPVVYLLHGYDGWYANWIIRVPELKAHADRYQLLIVCPDGSKNSWYFNSRMNPAMQYETYIGTEVPGYIDAHYKTQKSRFGRAITGLSMGGHGGLFLGLRHAATFGACGSMSGGVDIKPFAEKWGIKTWIGDPDAAGFDWKEITVADAIEKYPRDSVAIIFDCGVDDFFYETNNALHEKMVRLKIPHSYMTSPGGHDWAYWQNAIQYQLLFFSDFFNKKNIPGN
ncbi:alpha/beta hydrolase [Niabella drilacis]|uniref:S-formylglutathione hydrolase FrmB n=1 Tax=Niabella drilacis (strain DSM 25811 / CCM 8410 / CCUG 62505 / LMG 26954 / E90) TaxID=1285928 RepID=A0A1G6VVM9_NIADE|nr:alpha/beta hydrolase family protein [Niabella drilacis]SDD57692.1 S-formylglutathione hydrolase FrmB [Niabella drilacis]